MPQQDSIAVKVCAWIAKYAIYSAVFLMPVFFLPWTSEALDFNKQALLMLLAFVSLFAWMLKVLISGKLKFAKTSLYIFAGALFVALSLSTFFSIDRHGSFWGWPRVTSDSLFSLIVFLVFAFLASNNFSKKEIFKSVYIFSASVLVAGIYGALQLLGVFSMPFSFAKDPGFNTLGGTGVLAIFMAIIVPLMSAMLIFAKKWAKLLFGFNIAIATFIIIFVNYSTVWWTLAAGCAVFLGLGIIKRNSFDGRWMALPMFFLAVSVLFLALNLQINFPVQKANEISLSPQATMQINLPALKEDPVLGSGPGTFSYDFSKFRSADFLKTVLWSVSFSNGSSKFFTMLATSGILGLLAMLAFAGAAVFLFIKKILQLRENSKEDSALIISIGIFSAFLAEAVSFFLRNSNFTLDFVFFFFIACMAGLLFDAKKEYDLKPSSISTLVTTFVFTVVFIFGLGLLMLGGQRYVADAVYSKGITALAAGQKEQALKSLEKAASMAPNTDFYLNQLAQTYLLSIQDVAQDKSKSQEDKAKIIQQLISNSVNAAKFAADTNPKNPANWIVRGYIYQNLMGQVPEAETWAINSFDQALTLDPHNVYAMTQKAVVMVTQKKYEDAKKVLDRALELKPDYSNALYFAGLVYDQLGDKEKAAKQFEALAQLNPESAKDIQKIIDNLKAGKGALEGLVQPASPSLGGQAPETQTPVNAETSTPKK